MSGKRLNPSHRVLAIAAPLLAAGGCNGLFPLAVDDSGASSATDTLGAAKVYFVSPGGDDAFNGLSPSAPFRTIAVALGVVRPGDTVAILPGSYDESLTLSTFGDPQATTTIRGEGGTPVLNGGRTRAIGFACVGCTNVTLEGLEIRDFSDIGVLVTNSSSVVVRNLEVHDNGFAARSEPWIEGYGIHADDSSDVTIEANEVYRNGPAPQTPNRWLGTGINAFALTDAVIRNNSSHSNIGGGLLVEDSTNILVEDNVITANNLDATVEGWWDGGIWIDGGHDLILRRNTVRDNVGPGIQVSDEDNRRPFGYVLEENLITGNHYGLYVWNFGTSELPTEDILVLSNNTISGNTMGPIWVVDWLCPAEDPCE